MVDILQITDRVTGLGADIRAGTLCISPLGAHEYETPILWQPIPPGYVRDNIYMDGSILGRFDQLFFEGGEQVEMATRWTQNALVWKLWSHRARGEAATYRHYVKNEDRSISPLTGTLPYLQSLLLLRGLEPHWNYDQPPQTVIQPCHQNTTGVRADIYSPDEVPECLAGYTKTQTYTTGSSFIFHVYTRNSSMKSANAVV